MVRSVIERCPVVLVALFVVIVFGFPVSADAKNWGVQKHAWAGGGFDPAFNVLSVPRVGALPFEKSKGGLEN